MDPAPSPSLERPAADTRSLSDLIGLARSGRVRMPRFQRPFRWRDRDVLLLFDSLRRGFPIGSLLLWERSAPAATVAFGSFSVKATAHESALWVVDGQQRLTSLVASLTHHEDVAPPFELYFDLQEEEFVRRGTRRAVPLHWLPVNVLLDTNRLLEHLMGARDRGLSADEVDKARALATVVADYKMPLFVVRTEDEPVLREIFHRMNTAGAKMTSAEVFRALHASFDAGDPRNLSTVIDHVASLGFGTLREDTILRCVLAVRGGDVYRSFEHEFPAGESPAETFNQTVSALGRVIAFLRDDASIPHARALPYAGVLPVLTRFFALHPDPQPRVRLLLRRWIWRGSMEWGRDVSALRRAVQDVNEDAEGSVDALLGDADKSQTIPVDLDAVQLNRAAAKRNIALLSALHPVDLEDGGRVNVAQLLEDEGPGAMLELIGDATPSLVGRILHRDVESDLLALLASADEASLRSHAISPAARDALVAGDGDTFLRLRGESLALALAAQQNRLAEPNANDRHSIETMKLSNEVDESE